MSSDATPREPFHRTHRSFFVGLFILVPLIGIPIFVVFTLVKMELFAEWHSLHVQYDNCYGLISGNRVTISGIRAGYVDKVVLTHDGRAAVSIRVLKEHAHLVRKNTRAILMQSNMVTGDWEVSLAGGDPALPAAAGGDTLVPELPLRIDKVVEQMTVMAEAVQSIIKDVADGGGLIGYLLKEDTLIYVVHGLLLEARRFLSGATHVLGDARGVLATFDGLGGDGATFLDTLTDIVLRIGPVVDEMRTLIGKVDGAADDFSGVVDKVDIELDHLGEILNGLEKHWLLRRTLRNQKEKNAP